jgi:hypothetical protein
MEPRQSIALPLEPCGWGMFSARRPEHSRWRVREWVLTMLRRFLPTSLPRHIPYRLLRRQRRSPATDCSGSEIARYALWICRLRRKLASITARDVPRRMDTFLSAGTDVMAIAAVVFVALYAGGTRREFWSRVGVKEGVLGEVVRSLYGAESPDFQPTGEHCSASVCLAASL